MAGFWNRLFGREMKSDPNRGLIALHLSGRGRSIACDIATLRREGYERNAIAHRCVRLICEAASAVPFTSRHDRVQVLLDQPNADQSGPEWIESFLGHLQLTGNAYAELIGLDKGTQEIHVLRPDRMRVLPGLRGWPDGWEYSTGRDKRKYARDLVSGRSPILHMRLFHPGDDHYGFAPMQAAAEALDLHNTGSRWARALLDNAARPSGALIVNQREGDGRLSDEQFDRLKEQLCDLHSGAGNAGRPLLLEGGLDWKPMALSPADMDFAGARREAAREIALAFGVPPLLLGLPGDNTYANYREANLAFWRQTVSPLANKLARSLTGWLRPWFGPDVAVETDESSVPALRELVQ